MVRETVAVETRATRATSLDVHRSLLLRCDAGTGRQHETGLPIELYTGRRAGKLIKFAEDGRRVGQDGEGVCVKGFCRGVLIVAAFDAVIWISTFRKLPWRRTPTEAGGSSAAIGMGTQRRASSLPVHDSENRPITAGGFVDSGPMVFQDVSKQAGLTVWRHKMGSPRRSTSWRLRLGVALLDYDNDGWLDIYVRERLDLRRARRQRAGSPCCSLSQ
jgi:hypothetical protein